MVCLDEKTGRELVAEWSADESIARAVADYTPWPGRESRAQRVGRTGPIERYYPVELVGPRGPFYENWTLQIDQRRQHLVARDGLGKERWKLAVKDDSGRQFGNIYGNYARVRGHLLVVVLGTQFLVLDTLGGDSTPRVLWKRDMFEATPANMAFVQNMPVRQIVLPGGARKLVVMDPQGRPLGKVGAITDEAICYQVGTKLVAADPLTGETLWERTGVARGSEIFGDEEHLFVVAPSSTQALVLRTSDGEHVATRPFPQGESLLSTSGRQTIAWNAGGEKGTLAAVDVLSGKTVWKHEFAAASKFDIVKDEEIAVLEPQGRLAILSIADGALHIDSPVAPDDALAQITVRRSAERYIVLTNHPHNNQNNVQTAILGFDNRLINGMAYGFDRRTGEKVWATPIEQQAVELSQPEELPLLVFTVRTYRLFQQGQIRSRNQFSLAILDTNTGRIVHEHEGNEALAPFQIEADRRKELIDVNFYNAAIRITWPEATAGG
jgi:outer membrane protein assembly factor BamB